MYLYMHWNLKYNLSSDLSTLVKFCWRGFIWQMFVLDVCIQCHIMLITFLWKGGTIEILGNNLTYLLTPWCRVILEKLTGLQLDKKFPAFHGTRRFITSLTRVRQLSLSWASPIQSIYPHPTSWRSILILSTHLCLGLPSVGTTNQNPLQ